MRKTGISLDLARKAQSQTNQIKPQFQWLVASIIIALLALIVGSVNPSWIASWGSAKFIVFGLGVPILAIAFCGVWMFGGVGRKVGITWVDILFGIGVMSTVGLSLLHGDQQVIWGSATRAYDGVMTLGLLGILYYIVRLSLSQKLLGSVLGIVGSISLMGALLSGIGIVSPNTVGWLSPTFSVVSGASHQLGAIAIVSALFVKLASQYTDGMEQKIYLWIWWIAVGAVFVVLEFVSMRSFHILWAAVLGLSWIQNLSVSTQTPQVSPWKTLVWGLPIVYSVLTIWFVSLPGYAAEILPGPQLSWSIARQSIMERPLIGSGTVQYGWSQFFPAELLITPQWNLTFDTLGSEITNLIVKFGAISFAIFGVLAGMIILYTALDIFKNKTLSTEYILGATILICMILVPFEMVMKVFAILSLVAITLKFERVKSWLRISVGSYHVTSLSPQGVSVGSIISLTAIVLAGFAGFQYIQLGRGYQSLAQAVRAESEEQFLELSGGAVAQAPMFMDFGEILIDERIGNLDQRIRELAEEDPEALEDIQRQLQSLDQLIAEYEQAIPGDIRVYQARIDLLMLTHEFGEQSVPQVLEVIDRAQPLRRNSPIWDRYRAQYYAIAYRKSQAQEEFDLALASIDRALAARPVYVEGTLLKADIYNLVEDSQADQIESLESYLEITQERGFISDRRVVYRLAQEYQESERLIEAQNLLTQLTQAFPEFTNAWFTLGQVNRDLGNRAQAREALEKAQELDQESPEIQQELNSLGL